MRKLLYVPIVAIVVWIAAAPAEAQRRRVIVRNPVPDGGMVAVGASIGATIPSDRFFENGLEATGTIEGYLTPRVSVRGQVGAAWWDIIGVSRADMMKPLFLDGNVVYTVEGGEWHPYVTAGIGMYHYKFTGDRGDDSDTDIGVNVGGGVEYFLSRHTTLTGEVLYHHVGQVQTAGLNFAEGSFWSIRMGVKAYLWRLQ